jgi:hypothetical protein
VELEMFQDMIKHRSKILLTLLTVIFLTLSSCASLKKVKDINITSVGVESYSFSGLRSINAVLAIGIDNPTFAFRVTRLNGILKYKGEDFAFYSADTLHVDSRCVKVYDLPCSATLSDGVNLLKAMQIARDGSLDGFTTDVEAKVKLKSGAGTTLKFKDLDLKKMTEK